ncbi:MAG: DUF4255 domain-containing protein [Gemmatimonadota bacterium]
MSTWNAIAATSRTILGLLEGSYPSDFGKLTFALVHASAYQGAPIPAGFTLCLYRVGINGPLRRVPRTGPNGIRFRPSLALDLHYLLTPWADNVETQQSLLGWGMRRIEDNPILTAGMLNHAAGPPNVFASHETVELVFDPLALADFSNLWDKLEPRMQTSVTYIARMILIDSEIEQPEGPLGPPRAFDPPRA